MRPRSGLLAPHVYFDAVWHPRRCPIPASGGSLGLRSGAHREGRSSLFRRKMRPRSGLLAPHVIFDAVWHPRCCPIPASGGSLGLRSGSHGIGLLGFVVPARIFGARLMIIPITSNALTEDSFGAFLRGRGAKALRLPRCAPAVRQEPAAWSPRPDYSDFTVTCSTECLFRHFLNPSRERSRGSCVILSLSRRLWRDTGSRTIPYAQYR
jgi:hypothetical protein